MQRRSLILIFCYVNDDSAIQRKKLCRTPIKNCRTDRIIEHLKKAVLKNFAIFTGKKPVLELESLFNKVAGLQACNFIKKRLEHRCFPVNFAKFLRTLILKRICGVCF